MRKLYLIRHGAVESPTRSLCLGSRSDPPLSPEAALECRRLSAWFHGRGVKEVFSSPMARCLGMAPLIFDREPAVLADLTEMDMGEWDGLDFQQIREKYPRLYKMRGENPLIPPPGGEPPLEAQQRFRRAIDRILQSSEGDVAVISHGGVIRLFLCRVLDMDPGVFTNLWVPRGSVTVLEMTKEGLQFCGTLLPEEAHLDLQSLKMHPALSAGE